MDTCFEPDLFDDIFSPSPEETLNASLSSPSIEENSSTTNFYAFPGTENTYSIPIGHSPTFSFSPTLTGQNSSQFLLDSNVLQNLVVPVPVSYVPALTPIVANSVSDESSSNDGELEDIGRRKRRNAVRLKNDMKRSSPSSSGDERSVTLTRDELLSFTSEQFEDFVTSIINSRDLTSSEKSEIKRQRRLIKNRESAQASRQRKKLHMDQLERKVKELSSENTVLKENIATLCSENNQLKQHVALLNEVVKKSMGTDLFSRGYNFMNTMANPKQYIQMNPTGVVLMIVLFSFGILFSNWVTPNNAFPGTNPMVELPVPQITNGPRIFEHQDFEYASNSRNPLVVLQDQEIPMERLEKSTCDAVELHPAITDGFEPTQNDVSSGIILSTPESTDEISTAVTVPVSVPIPVPVPGGRLYLGPVPDPVTLRNGLYLKTEARIPHSEEPLRITQSNELRFSIENETELTELRPHISVWKANTTYLLCGKVSQISPAAGTLFTDTEQQDTMISFFIPPDKGSTDKLFLMVTCKVIETAYTPAATVEISNPVSLVI
jgi:hypothetical protein